MADRTPTAEDWQTAERLWERADAASASDTKWVRPTRRSGSDCCSLMWSWLTRSPGSSVIPAYWRSCAAASRCTTGYSSVMCSSSGYCVSGGGHGGSDMRQSYPARTEH